MYCLCHFPPSSLLGQYIQAVLYYTNWSLLMNDSTCCPVFSREFVYIKSDGILEKVDGIYNGFLVLATIQSDRTTFVLLSNNEVEPLVCTPRHFKFKCYSLASPAFSQRRLMVSLRLEDVSSGMVLILLLDMFFTLMECEG